MRDLLELYQNRRDTRGLEDLHDLLQPTLEELVRTFGFIRTFVVQIDVEQEVLQDAFGVGVPEELLERLRTEPSEPPSVLVQALRQGRLLRVDDALLDPRVPNSRREYYARYDMLAFVVIPLLPGSCVLVVAKERPLTEAEINELLPYAGRLTATMIERQEARRLRASDESHAVEKEWLWWMLNAVHDPVLLSDERNNILLYNRSAERLLTTSPEDSPGKRRAIELNNVLLSAALSGFVLDPGTASVLEQRELVLVDPIEGDELLFEVICQPATNLRTGERGLVSVLRDVTDLRRATDEVSQSLRELRSAGEQARRERDRLNLVLENVADPIVVTDPRGEIVLMNQQADRLFQVSEIETNEQVRTSFFANDTRLSTFLAQFALDPESVRRDELQLVDPVSEEPLTLGITATKVLDQFGQLSAVVSVLHDLTRLRELERRRVEQQLFESEKLAAVGRLAAAVAHEINNPLEAIKNALYLVVSRTPEDDPNRRFLEIASKETQRVSGIIRQMLGFYRPTSARVPVDVNAVLEECVMLLQRQLRQHRIAVHSELGDGLPRIPGSADELKQVFLNLLLNAQEAMPDGGTLTVATRLSDETDPEFLAGRHVLVQIGDTGTGIAEEHLPHIFEPFYSTKSDARGTGLGLWVSMGVIQNHRGQIKVRSRAGRGTTFTIALPTEERS